MSRRMLHALGTEPAYICLGTDVPYLCKGCPESGTPGVVLERAAEFLYSFDAFTLEHLRDVLHLGKAAGRWPVDDFRELPRIEVLAESTRGGGVRPKSVLA